MQRIFTHIERLLLTNDCVIIPEFGGFVLHPCPATYLSEVHKFCPPGKSIVFNSTLVHYDKLLSESYIQMYGMTVEEAHISLRKDIEELRQLLDKDGAVNFEKAGFLRKDDDGKLFFEVERNTSFVALRPYGLFSFHLPPVVQNRQKTETAQIIKLETKPKRVVYMPLKRAMLLGAGVSAAALALFLLVSIPVNNVGRSSYSAGLIPSGITSKVEIGETGEIEKAGEIGEEGETVETVKVVEQETVAETKPAIKATEATTQRIYYAIIGSFKSETQANQFIKQINMPELINMGIVINDERVRVYADKYNNRDEAQNYILRLRENVKLKDTWLFVGQ
jgi:hypothetical protein